MVALKRSYKDDDVESLAMANCVMLISRMDEDQSLAYSGRVYECKTCKKTFQSFQALGGHRASHKRPRVILENGGAGEYLRDKKHVCGVCGLEFERGQALGGHMSKHRTRHHHQQQQQQQLPAHNNNNKSAEVVVVKEQREDTSSSESIKAVVVSWDLNLSPFQNEINELIDASRHKLI